MTSFIRSLTSFPILAWMAYFLILICVALPHGMRTPLTLYAAKPVCAALKDIVFPCRLSEPLYPSATNAQIIRAFDGGSPGRINDPGMIADAARRSVISGKLQPTAWPPGLVSLEAALYWLSPEAPVGLILVVLICGVWAAAFDGLFLVACDMGLAKIVAFAIPLPLLLTSEMRTFMSTYAFNAEPLAIGSFLAAIGLLNLLVARSSLGYAAAAGIVFAISAYIREQVDLVMMAALGLLILLATVALINRPAPARRQWLGLIAVTLASYHLATMPYRVYNHFRWGDTTDNVIWPLVWQTEQELLPDGQYIAWDGGCAGCSIDPAECAYIHARRQQEGDGVFTNRDYFLMTLASYVRHPLAWVSFKIPYILRGWFDGGEEPRLLAVAGAAAMVLFLVYGGTIAWTSLFITAATFIGVIGPLLAIHTEPRFFLLLKLLAAQQALIAGALVISRGSIRRSKPVIGERRNPSGSSVSPP